MSETFKFVSSHQRGYLCIWHMKKFEMFQGLRNQATPGYNDAII